MIGYIFRFTFLRYFHDRADCLILPVSVGKRGEILQRAHLLILPAFHVRLLVGGNLVRFDTRPSRIGQFGVETGVPFLLQPVLLGRGENQPHTADEQEEHSGKDQVFPDFLPLFQVVRIVTHCLIC